jgi:hypothetical protein
MVAFGSSGLCKRRGKKQSWCTVGGEQNTALEFCVAIKTLLAIQLQTMIDNNNNNNNNNCVQQSTITTTTTTTTTYNNYRQPKQQGLYNDILKTIN